MLKWSLFAIGGLVALAVLTVVIVLAVFDANDAKRRIVQAVAERTGRTLAIEGDLELSVFPRVGVSLGRTTLSEPRSSQVAVRIENARLAVALLPLLSKQIRVDRIVLDGLTATLVRDKRGATNFDDLLGTSPSAGATQPDPRTREAPAAPAAFDIAAVQITRASIAVRDAVTGTDLGLSNLDLRTGRLADGVETPIDVSVRVDGKQPALAGDAHAKGRMRFELAPRRYAFEGLEAGFRGRVGPRELDAGIGAKALRIALGNASYAAEDVRVVLKGKQPAAGGTDTFDVTLTLPQLNLTPAQAAAKEIKAVAKLAGPRDVDAELVLNQVSGTTKALSGQLALGAKGREKRPGAADRAFAVSLKSPLAANLDTLAFELGKLAGAIELDDAALPTKKLVLPVDGSVRAEIEAQRIAASLATRFDDAPAQLRLGVAGFDAPRIDFDLDARALDVDRLFPPAPKGTTAAAGPAPAATKEPPSAPAGSGQPPGATPLDLTALKGVDVDGKVRVGQLVARGIKASNVNVGIAVHGGRAKIAPMSLALYGGTAEGTASVDANGNAIAIAQKLTNVQLGPLLRDAAQIDRLEGRGNVTLDVRGAGASVDAIKRSLGGNAAVRVNDGALKGIDYAQRLRGWRERFRDVRSLSGASNERTDGGVNERTDFSELTATFQIANGVATSKDLDVKAPLVRLAGAGAIDIGHDRIDYTVDASLVSTLTGQGGKSRDQAGVEIMVPVRVVGPLAAPDYEVQWARAAQSALSGALGTALERALNRSNPSGAPGTPPAPGNATDPAKKDTKKELRDQLKGLLGR